MFRIWTCEQNTTAPQDHEISLKELIDIFQSAPELKKTDIEKIETELRKELTRSRLLQAKGAHARAGNDPNFSMDMTAAMYETKSFAASKTPVMYGPLLKMSAAIHGKWQERMFYLSPTELVWYAAPNFQSFRA